MSDSTDAKTLPALPDESWTRVLCVVAHPDDMEYGASAAVATWARRGVNVTYLLLTSGGRDATAAGGGRAVAGR